ncbi:hypothetical protein AB0L80_42970 [Streptomyces sp. NPDC052069]|uniref:hypothetical protein n=1 Tax=Streptomyces sp. NPDC052069 TaxID=3154650 RepID=UPI0034259B3B
MPKPIIPTQVIPGGAPLPGRPPEPDEIPPWRVTPGSPTGPPPPAPPAVATPAPAPPPPPQVHVHVVVPYEAPPEPTRWERLKAWLTTIGRPWQIGGALLLVSLPVFDGHSAATLWASCVAEVRAEEGQDAGYALALTPLAIAVIRITRSSSTRGGLGRLLLLAISIVGLAGAIDLYDPVTWITGVHPS